MEPCEKRIQREFKNANKYILKKKKKKKKKKKDLSDKILFKSIL